MASFLLEIPFAAANAPHEGRATATGLERSPPSGLRINGHD